MGTHTLCWLTVHLWNLLSINVATVAIVVVVIVSAVVEEEEKDGHD